MKAVYYEEFGGPEVLQVGERPTPEPELDEVQIKIQYASVNPVDWEVQSGKMAYLFKSEFPAIPGWDAAGTISAIGSDVRGFEIGDEVYAYCKKPVFQWGTYCEYICFTADHVVPKPKSLTMAQAAAIPLCGLTAYQTLFDYGNIRRDQRVLIHAGAGGVGCLAIPLAKHVGCTVYSTAGTGNQEFLKELGVDVPIDYTAQDFTEVITEKLDLIFDLAGGEALDKSYDLVKEGGTIVTVAAPIDRDRCKALGIRGASLVVRPNGEELSAIAQMLDQGQIPPPPIEEFPLEEAAAAQAKSSAGHVRGKLVLRVGLR